MLWQYIYIYINDCVQTDSIQNYLNSRAKSNSGYMENGNNITTSIMETNIGDDSDTVTDNNEGKRWIHSWFFNYEIFTFDIFFVYRW